MSDMVKDWLAECTDGRVSKQTQQILEAFANWQAAAIAAMQADAAPVAWMYERGPETIILQEQLHRDGVLRGVTGWTETPLYAHPPLTEQETVAKIVAWLRDGARWLNGGECCGQKDSDGVCLAPACIWGQELGLMHDIADAIEAGEWK